VQSFIFPARLNPLFYFCVMPKKWGQPVSWIVLVSFIILLLPKSLWHDCSHAAHTKTEHCGKHSKHIEQSVEKCAACDLHIPLLSNPADRLAVNVHTPVIATSCTSVEGPLAAVSESIFLRGPPTV
jgi:hypothetical protein